MELQQNKCAVLSAMDEKLDWNTSSVMVSSVVSVQRIDLDGPGRLFLLVYLICLIITTVCGNIGNVMVMGAVLMDKQLRKTGNLFILNLALADLCVTGFVDPFSIAGVFLGHEWFLSRYVLCHIIGSVCLISCVCSLWTIAGISINRYILLCRPALYQRLYTWKRTGIMLVALWLGASTLDLPNFFNWGDHTYDMKTMACSYDRLASYSYTVFFITMFVTVPLVTVLFCNINIYVVVVKSKIRVAAHTGAKSGAAISSGETGMTVADEGTTYNGGAETIAIISNTEATIVGSNMPTNGTFLQVPGQDVNGLSKRSLGRRKGKSSTKNDVKLAKTLFIIFIVFCICWTPYALLCLIDKNDLIIREAYAFSILLAHASSTINSILYAVTNKSFRNGYCLFLNKCGLKCFKQS